MKEYTLTLTDTEDAALRAIWEPRKEALRGSWDVDTFEEFLHLMAIHGTDSISALGGAC